MDEMKVELAGSVSAVIYQNEENGYTVLRLDTDDGGTATVVGCLPFAVPGEQLLLEGTWSNHQTHGMQFKAESAERLMPSTVNDIYLYLASGTIKGVGPATAKLIVERFGEDSLIIMDEEPERLEEIDPEAAARLHPNDVRRVVRALEIFDLTGVPMSEQKMPGPEECPYDFQLYALELPRSILYARIEQRVDEMMKDGLLEEVRALHEKGVDEEAQSMQGLGYKELLPVVKGEMPLADAVSLLKLRTRHYAKRQLTWFKRDERIQWLPWKLDMDLGQLAAMICQRYMEK